MAPASTPATSPDGLPTGRTGDVWLPFPPEEVEGLPDTLTYHHWDGEREFPADPADCAVYVVPYMRGQDVAVRPLDKMPHLRYVQTLTAGIDHMIPAVPLLPSGTVVCNARGVHDASTAELALTLALAALRNLPQFVRDQREGRWRPVVHRSLADSHVLIVGYGSIGAAIEERLLPFEVSSVTRVARTARQAPRGAVRPLEDLPQLLPEADVVVLSLPLNQRTTGLVDAGFLAAMRDGALLVNVARGGVVDTGALLSEVAAGRLLAALDVTDPEPLPADHPLWQQPGALITPHVGGPTTAFYPRAKRLLRDQLNRWAAGEPPLHQMVVAD